MKPAAARHRGLAPQVTVAIPTRNRLALLQEAVRSVLSQSVKCWELIVVDDASSDGTWTWLSSLRDDRVRIVRNEQPTERSAARNRALALARTPYILYLDDDDRLTPRALQCLISGVQRAPGVTAVIGRRVLFDEHGNRRLARHVRRRTTRWAWQDVMVGWGAGVGTALCRVETVRAVGGWDESLDVAEDQDLLLRLTTRGPVQLVPDLALEQRMRPARPQPEEAKRAELSVREAFLAGAGSTRRRPAERTFRSWQARRAGDAAMADRRYARALRSYAQEIWRCPALLRSPLVRPHWVAQTAKALIGCCLGGYGASAARSVKARARLAVKRAPGERPRS
jgi:GT2 family glycosyltransferase